MAGDTTGVAYIYALCDPRDGAVRYVGKTKRLPERMAAHVGQDRRSQPHSYKTRWINALLSADLKPVLMVLEVVPIEDWQSAERRWIALHREQGARLVNATGGGDGIEGYRHTPEARARIGEAAKGRHVGRKRSAEARARMSIAGKMRNASPEDRAKMALACAPPFVKPKPTGPPKGHPCSEEARAKIAAGLKARWADPEGRAKLTAKQWGRPCTPEMRAKIGAANKGNTNCLGRNVSQETRAKMSVASKAVWAGKKQEAQS